MSKRKAKTELSHKDEIAISKAKSVISQKDEIVIPRIVEELSVQKREIVTANVSVHKIINERQEIVDEPVIYEEVDIERVPINQVITAPIPIRQEGDTMIVPVIEEVLFVEKRLMLKEELRITKRKITTSQPQKVTLRSEEVVVERTESPHDTNQRIKHDSNSEQHKR